MKAFLPDQANEMLYANENGVRNEGNHCYDASKGSPRFSHRSRSPPSHPALGQEAATIAKFLSFALVVAGSCVMVGVGSLGEQSGRTLLGYLFMAGNVTGAAVYLVSQRPLGFGAPLGSPLIDRFDCFDILFATS